MGIFINSVTQKFIVHVHKNVTSCAQLIAVWLHLRH